MAKIILGLFKLLPLGNGFHQLQKKHSEGWEPATTVDKRQFVTVESLQGLAAAASDDKAVVDYLAARGIL